MSEPMSSGDIEDVLSSIRRLVSEDLRPVAKPAEGVRAVVTEPTGKLLLTPALRVVTAQESRQESGAEPASSFTVDRSGPKAATYGATVEAVQVDDDDDAFVESAALEPDDSSQARPNVVQPAAAMPDPVIPEAAQPESAVTDEDWLPESQNDELHPGWAQAAPPTSDNTVARSAAASKLTRVVSEIGAGVSEVEDDWEPETGDAPVTPLSWQAPEWVEEAELADDERFEAAFDAAFDAGLEDGFDKSAADLAEDAAVAEIMARAAAAKAQAKVEPAKAEPVKEAAKPEAAKDDIFAEDETVFDETVLRDLVRDLIREELSGTLGERITRNVRKLVRAEINRALTARDFD